MNNIETLKLALEALEYAVDGNNCHIADPAITALRQAIEQAQNPLHDDAAAFRFLMKYNLGLVHGWESVPDATALATVWISFQGNNCIAEEVKGDDPMAAARRAIVSAVHYIENDLQEDLRD